MELSKQLQQFVEYVTKEICEHKSDISVEVTEDDRGMLVELSVNTADMGRIIGKSGKMVDAFRQLLHVMGARHQKRVSLKVIEPTEA